MDAFLPIHSVLAQLLAALRVHRNVVLQAPPGAGKSTVVPLALLDQPWVAGRRILLLEPRRLAARAIAMRMASALGEAVGERVGYRMRLDTRVSAVTRIEVVTEGILSALVQRDPALEGIGCVIFDEFHERSLQTDLGLALCLDVQAHLHESLRLLAMSATLAAEPLARLLDGAPIVRAEGRSFPVEVRYVGAPTAGATGAAIDPRANAQATAALVRRALAEQSGDVLVFLPGTAEIRRVQDLLEETCADARTRLVPLYGDLPREAQDRALAPSPPGERKVVLATNIAETSLTIEGVRVVVDSGLTRRARFDPVSGMSRLMTLRVSRAAAEQRRGRAGRLASGVCYRLWSEGAQAALEPFTPPEILVADLAPLALDLAGWNVVDPRALRWLDAPPAAAYAQARELLQRLGALDTAGRITAHGRRMVQLRAHPRLAHLLLRAGEFGLTSLACDLAALLAERDVLRGGPEGRQADIRLRVDCLETERAQAWVDRGALQRVRRTAAMYRRQLDNGAAPRTQARVIEPVGALLALAYPDRIARWRAPGSGRYRLSNGRGACFAEPQNLSREEFLAVAELDGAEREARIDLAAPLACADLERLFAEEIQSVDRIEWDSQVQAVNAVRERRLGVLAVEEVPLERPDPGAVRQALLAGIRALSLMALPWNDTARQWQARVLFVHRLSATGPQTSAGEWPDVSDPALLASLERWLGPWLEGMTRREHLARLDLTATLAALLDWEQQRALEVLAPTHVTVPSGARIPVNYLEEIPSISVRLQEMFGLHATPLVGGGRVALVVKLLSPAHRPVQVTRDLANFWRSGYHQVRKELKGRYPKHYWPEDPFSAIAIRGSRKPRL